MPTKFVIVIPDGCADDPVGSLGNHFQRASISRWFFAIFIVVQFTGPVAGQFTQIVDTNTPIPGGTGNFSSPLALPSVYGTGAVFVGLQSGFQKGVYSGTGQGLTIIADFTTPIPGGAGNFTSFSSSMSFSKGTVALQGGSPGYGGLFTKTGSNPFQIIISTNTPVPGGVGNFKVFGSKTNDGSTVAFLGQDQANQQGIYTGSDGTPTLIANFQTIDPGSGLHFQGFGIPTISNGVVAFHGSSSFNGIYTASASGGSLTTVAYKGTVLPGISGVFSNTNGGYSNLGGVVAFQALTSTGHTGIFAGSNPATLTKIVDDQTPMPGGIGNFTLLSVGNISNGRIAFYGAGSANQNAIYLANLDGTNLDRVVGNGDSIGSRVINKVAIGNSAFGDDTLAFDVTFTDGSEGFFTTVVAVPEPSSILLISGLFAGGLRIVRSARTGRTARFGAYKSAT